MADFATNKDPRIPLKIQPLRHPARWVIGIAVLLIIALFVKAFVASPGVKGSVIADYLFNHEILSGVVVTIEITLLAELGSIIIGLILAVFRLSDNPVLKAVSIGYVTLFRSIPLLVLLILIFNLAFLFPKLEIGIPFTGIGLSGNTNDLITGFNAAILGFSIHEGAYMGEIIRAGIQGVDRGQWDAAVALGAPRGNTLRRIILPQAMRLIIPPAGNNLINLLKATSLVAVISGADLLTQAETIYSRNFEVIPLLLVATLWYLFLVAVASVGQQYLERIFGEGGSSRMTTRRADYDNE